MKTKAPFCLKNLILLILLLCTIAVCCRSGFPAFPVSDSGGMDPSGRDGIVSFLAGNLFPILYFFFALAAGIAAYTFSFSLRRHMENTQEICSAGVMLGNFILLSGLWMLTDSKTLTLFFGSINAIVFASFVCFMLMPLPFLSCVKHLFRHRLLNVLNWLLFLNGAAFLLLTLLKAGQVCYLVSLGIHHILIFTLAIFLICVFLKNALGSTAPRKNLPVGILIFLILIIAALVLFILGLNSLYSLVYGTALIFLIASILKLLFLEMVHAYRDKVQLDVYKEMAYKDPLSKIGNRNAFLLEQQATAESAPLCYAVFDVNGLKNVNDRLGHLSGDSLIRAAADVITGAFSPIGKCYRIGGDEFAVICTGPEEGVMAALGRLDQLIGERNQSFEPKLSLAWGYACRQAAEKSPRELFDEADAAMYAHKAAMAPPDAY